MPASYKIAVIPGDGIGNEVMPIATQLLSDAGERFGFEVDQTWFDWGCERYLRDGSLMPEDGVETLTQFDAILLGAVGFPGVPDHVSLWGLLIPIRRRFDLYINLRPIRTYAGLPSRLAGSPEFDVVLVRENSEGEYSSVGGRAFEGTPREFAVQEAIFSRTGIERITRFAAEQAKSRGGKIVAATKSNGIVHTMPFWDEVVQEVATAEGVELEIQHVDALAARFVSNPAGLDVVLGSNLFGDILSDLGSALAGSLGLAASGNINPDTTRTSMFEPVHGSAPDIVGRELANPIGQVVSTAMMLRHLGETPAADALDGCVDRLLAEGGPRTPDIGGTATTTDVGRALGELLADAPATS